MNVSKKQYAVLYLRVSTDDQKAEGLSIDVQESLCRKKAEMDKYEVLEVINDAGISGFKDNRPGIGQLKDLIANGVINAVVALESSRLFRNTESHINFMKLAFKHGIKIIYVNQASPEDNATSKMTDTILANVNEFYRNLISDKVKDVLYAKVDAGYFPAVPAVGYRNIDNPDVNAERLAKKLIAPDPIAGPLITELFQLYSTGVYNVYDLTDLMNERGLRSHRGYKLSPSVIYNLLKNRIYLGEVKWGKAYNKYGKHKPLVDESTFNQVQAILEFKNHKACRRRKYQWLLNGFAYCATHGRRYVAEWHFKKTGNKTARAYYHCSNKLGCGRDSYCEMTDLERQVEEKFTDVQFSDEFTNLVIKKTKDLFLEKRRTYEGRRAGLVSKKTALEGRRKVAEDKMIDRVLADEDFKRIRATLALDLKQIDNELMVLEGQKELDVDVAQEVLLLTRDIHKAYRKASFNLKRQYLSLFWERFEVKDGIILKSSPSPLFSELLQAEEAYFKNPKSKNRENSKDFQGGILTTVGLLG